LDPPPERVPPELLERGLVEAARDAPGAVEVPDPGRLVLDHEHRHHPEHLGQPDREVRDGALLALDRRVVRDVRVAVAEGPDESAHERVDHRCLVTGRGGFAHGFEVVPEAHRVRDAGDGGRRQRLPQLVEEPGEGGALLGRRSRGAKDRGHGGGHGHLPESARL